MMSCLSFLCGKNLEAAPKQSEFDNELSRMYNVKELQTATNNFGQANIIGDGRFGLVSVYKGKLKDGRIAAIKDFGSDLEQGEFLMEARFISEVEHENLVKLELYGCCVESFHKYRVCKYLENKSLAETLLEGGPSSIHFSWRTQVKICIGVAKGLAYLHEEVIKARKILLDNDLTPKISDFGFANFNPSYTSVRRGH